METSLARITDLPGVNKLVKGRHGYFIVNSRDIHVGWSLLNYGEYSEGEFHLFQRICRPGDVVVEAGSNIGALTVPLARLVGEAGCVVAFEPQPVIFQMLCANLALNSLTNAVAHPCALAAQAGHVTFPWIDYTQLQNYSGIKLLDAKQGVRIEVRPLDEIFDFDQLRLLKADVEGMEAEVIRGARRVITTLRPILYVENNVPEKSENLIRMIWSLGYKIYWHVPPMFNPENFFDLRQDIFGDIFSLNMLCAPKEADLAVEGLKEITDPTFHPKRR